MSKSIWTDSELDALARSLLFKYPGRGFDRATQPHQIDLNDLEVTPLLQNAMPPHRQALRPKLNRLKRDLVPALMRVTGRATPSNEAIEDATAHLQPAAECPAVPFEATTLPTPLPDPDPPAVEPVAAPQAPATAQADPELEQATQSADNDGEEDEDEIEAPTARRKGNKHKQSKIRWSDDEWRFCALALHTMCPALNLVEAKTMAGVTLRELNMAASMMEPGRQRHFKWLKGPAARLMQEYERARRDRDPFYYGNPIPTEETVQVAALEPAPEPVPEPPPPPVAEKAPEPEPVKPTVATPREKPAGATFSRVGEQRIFWSTAEWVEIALEIDRLHPHSKYIERGTTGALTVQDIVQAQRVLPQERRRQLRTAPMDKLRVCLLDAFKEVKRMRAETAKAQHAEALQGFEERRAAQIAPPAPAANPWESALRPLVDLFIQQLGAQLVPMIVQALATGKAPAASTAPASSVTDITALLGNTAKTAAAPKPKKMSIGVCNNRLTFADELRREFPDVEFTFIEVANPHLADSVKNCDKVLLMTKWTSHTMQNRLKKQVGDRLILVNGSVSDIKRVVNGLLNSTERKTA